MRCTNSYFSFCPIFIFDFFKTGNASYENFEVVNHAVIVIPIFRAEFSFAAAKILEELQNFIFAFENSLNVRCSCGVVEQINPAQFRISLDCFPKSFKCRKCHCIEVCRVRILHLIQHAPKIFVELIATVKINFGNVP